MIILYFKWTNSIYKNNIFLYTNHILDEIKLPDIQSIFKDNKLSLSEIKSDKSGMEKNKSFKQENISYTSKMDYSVAQKSTTAEQSGSEITSQLHGSKIS